MAVAVLDDLAGVTDQKKPIWPSKGLVFTTTGRTPISGFSRAKQNLDAAMLKTAKAQSVEAGKEPESIEIADWRIHDLRRTMSTGFQKLGVRFEVTEATLNHISGKSRAGVAGVYQQHDWKEESGKLLKNGQGTARSCFLRNLKAPYLLWNTLLKYHFVKPLLHLALVLVVQTMPGAL